MSKYKVCVYAICKNEEKFVDRWYESVKEADKIFVLDTGSEDKTVEKLKSKEKIIIEEEKITPWRFDIARNKSLDMVDEDTDICICTDLDEVIIPGWREIIESVWDNETTRLSYIFNWSIDKNGNPIVSFYADKIHSRHSYVWTHPVHEVLTLVDEKNEVKKTTDKLIINHYPDSNKSRSSYLPLLELSVREDPNDDRNMHYLGREYMYYGKWQECIDTLTKHLNLPTATWKDERCASMRFIARAYKELGEYDEARMWLDKAIKEAPYLREPYIEMAILEYTLENYNDTYKYAKEALKIKEHKRTYINETFSWDYTVYDLLSISSFHMNNFFESLYYVNKVIEMVPDNERLINNKNIIEDKIENNII